MELVRIQGLTSHTWTVPPLCPHCGPFGSLPLYPHRTIESKFQYFLQRTRRKGALQHRRKPSRGCKALTNPMARTCSTYTQDCSSSSVLYTATSLVSTTSALYRPLRSCQHQQCPIHSHRTSLPTHPKVLELVLVCTPITSLDRSHPTSL